MAYDIGFGQDGRKKIAIAAVDRKMLSVMRMVLMMGGLFSEEFPV